MPEWIAGFAVDLLLPQPLLRVEEEPHAVERQIESGRCRITGPVDRLGVAIAGKHLDGLVLNTFAVNLDHGVGPLHADLVPRTCELRTAEAAHSLTWSGWDLTSPC